MLTPLHAEWLLCGDDLPERLRSPDTPAPSFSLPGAEALKAFSALIGSGPEENVQEASAPSGVPFALPALIPEDAPGEVTLSREIDFSDLHGDRAWLSFDMLCGQGSVTLDSLPPRFARPGAPELDPISLTRDFDYAPVTLDVTPALAAHRRFRLTLRFGASRPAGVCGPILLRTAAFAHMDDLLITPDPAAQTLQLSVSISAEESGDYLLRACLCPAKAPASPEEAPPCRDTRFSLASGETRTVQLGMSASLPVFVPGEPYAAPGMKVHLEKIVKNRRLPCDSLTRLCGFPGNPPAYTLPLSRKALRRDPEDLLRTLTGLHVTGVLLPEAAPDMLYRLLTRAGISAVHSAMLPPENKARLLRCPCAAFERSAASALSDSLLQADPMLSAWQLCGLVTYPRAADPGLLPSELLFEAAGRKIDPQAEDTKAVLAWLRAFSIRLRAEAMRQGKLRGALCAPGEYSQPDVAQGIQTALAPLHLSALPLCGAWWTNAHFSASLQAFIPKDVFSVDKSIRAVASLEDGEGCVIASTEFPCAPWRSGTGLLQAALPDSPCVLELVTRLYADGDVLEEATMPVYIGERGALEAAF